MPVARVLAVAGSDSGGGAGIQADIKSISALGGYALTALTALTAQNTEGVFGVHPVPPHFIRQQLELVLGDIGADAIKTGMLHSAEVIEAVVEEIGRLAPNAPLVVDQFHKRLLRQSQRNRLPVGQAGRVQPLERPDQLPRLSGKMRGNVVLHVVGHAHPEHRRLRAHDAQPRLVFRRFDLAHHAARQPRDKLVRKTA